MPLYEYECTQCHRHTEKIQKFSDPEITTCPHCGGPLQRVISAPAFALKGGGWYADGYGSKKPAGSTEAKADSGGGSSAEGGSSSPSDSGKSATPAPATEAKPAPSAPASSASTASKD